MSEKSSRGLPGNGWYDIRLRGFTDRAPLAAAWAWLDARPGASQPEMVACVSAGGRVLAQAVVGVAALPPTDRAAMDGYAVHAADCDGANAYNPLALKLLEPGCTQLPPGAACPIAAGWALPGGADAVLPFDAAGQAGAQHIEVLAPVAEGAGIADEGHGPGRDTALPGGQRLLPQHLAYLARLGVTAVPLIPRPLVRLVIPGPKWGADALTPLLIGLLERDGAQVEGVAVSGDGEELEAALHPRGATVVVIAGRSGAGPDDVAPPSIWAAGGSLVLHGLALQPGGSAGIGTLGDAAAVLLPGDPFACLSAYDMLAGRLVRRLAGLGTGLPYAVIPAVLDRKIVSGIGLTEIVPVQAASGRAQPVSAEAGLLSLLANGFVVVPEASEGYPAGSQVDVYLYGTARSGS